MSASFNDAAINAVFDRVESWAKASGRFEDVNGHEPKNAPGNGLSCSVWVQAIRPMPKGSGLAATTGVLVLNLRIYVSFTSQPFDAIDPNVLSATTDFMGAISGDLDFDDIANVRNVDLLGSSGTAMSAVAGYVEIDRRMFRVMTTTIPIIVNDMFAQAS